MRRDEPKGQEGRAAGPGESGNPPSPVRAYLALGSNLGDRAAHLAFARHELGLLPGSRIVASSAVEETAPLGGRVQPPYLNQMVLLETGLSPRQLLDACLAIEDAAGRIRREAWASRTLDIDIVRYGDETIREPGLVVPHPGFAEREFWQRELAEIERALNAGSLAHWPTDPLTH